MGGSGTTNVGSGRIARFELKKTATMTNERTTVAPAPQT